jgi:hypothetical protein
MREHKIELLIELVKFIVSFNKFGFVLIFLKNQRYMKIFFMVLGLVVVKCGFF